MERPLPARCPAASLRERVALAVPALVLAASATAQCAPAPPVVAAGVVVPARGATTVRACAEPAALSDAGIHARAVDRRRAAGVGHEPGARGEHAWWVARSGVARDTPATSPCGAIGSVPAAFDAASPPER